MNALKLSASVFGAGLLLASSTANAGFDWLLQLGLDVGGDELAKTIYTSGETETIKAGQFFYGAIGASYQGPSTETQLSLGWKFDSSTASNGSIDWDRYPIELLQFIKINDIRIGGGLTYHLNPRLKGSGLASFINADFDNAVGLIVEVDFVNPHTNHYVGGRITIIDYESPAFSSPVSGNSVGITVGLRL